MAIRACAIALGVFGFSLSGVGAAPQAGSLTAQEKAWLDAHPIIRLAPNPAAPPIEYFDAGGVFRGIAADYVSLIERKLGIRFDVIHTSHQQDSVLLARQRKADVWSAASRSPETLAYMLFTKPYFESPAVILVRDDKVGALQAEDLTGQRISVVPRFGTQRYFEHNYPELSLYPDFDVLTGLRKVSVGLADAMIINIALASHFMEQDKIINLRVAGKTTYTKRLSFAVRADWPLLHSAISKAFADISIEDREKIRKRWIVIGEPRWQPTDGQYAAALFAVLVLVLAGTLIWNRMLNRLVQSRTTEISRAENRLRTAVETMSEAFVHYDGKGDVVMCNNKFREIYGYSEDDTRPGTNVRSLIQLDLQNEILVEDGVITAPEFDIATYDFQHRAKQQIESGPWELELENGQWIMVHDQILPDGGVVSIQSDISAQKQISLELESASNLSAAAEANLRHAIDTMTEGFVYYDADERLVICNSQFRDLYGYSQEEAMPGVSAFDLFELDRKRGSVAVSEFADHEFANRRRKTRKSGEGYFELQLADGRWLQIRERLTDEGGVVSVQADITSRKLAEQDVAAKERLLRTAIDHMSGGFFMVDKDLKVQVYNDRWAELTDMPADALSIGMQLEELVRFRAGRGDYGDGDIEELTRERLSKYADRTLALNDEETAGSRILEVKRAVTDEDAIVSTFDDVTVRKKAERALAESERRFAAMLKDSPLAVSVVRTKDQKVLYANLRLFELFRISKDELETRKPRSYYAHGSDVDVVAEILQREGEVRNFEVELLRGDGTPFWCSASFMPIDYDGEPARLAWYFDTTDQKEAQGRIEAKEKQLRSAIDNMSGGIFMVDSDLRILISNANFARYYELPEELTAPGVSLTRALRLRAERGDYGPGDPEELLAERIESYKDTSIVWVEDRTPGGRIIELLRAPTEGGGMVALFNDITERAKAEEEVARQRELLFDVLSSASQGIAAFDNKFELVTHNQPFADAFLFDDETLRIGATALDLAKDIMSRREDGGSEDETETQAWVELLTSGQPVSGEVMGLDGKYYHVLSRPTSSLGFVATFTDFTERREAAHTLQLARDQAEETEAKIRAILETLPIGVLVLDGELNIDYWNQAYSDVTGLTSKILEQLGDYDKLIRYVYDTFGHHEDGGFPDFIEERKTISLPARHQVTEQKLRQPDIDIQHIAAPLPNGGHVNAIVDITLQKDAQREALQARDAAEAAALAKSSFLAAMSHEIRTPMNGVIGMLDLLTKSKLDESQRDMADTIRSSAFTLLQIIDDILDFSKIEAGKLNFEHLPFSICEAVEAVAETLIPGARQKGLVVSVFVDPTIPDFVLGDAVRLRQILINLVGNAIKFTSAGNVKLRAMLPESDVKGRIKVIFSVEDTGIGIPAEVQDRLFDPFVQAESSTTRRFGGTGLGLSICTHLAEMQGGQIAVESQPDEGTTFTVTLYFDPAAGPDEDSGKPINDLSGLRILVVARQAEIGRNLSDYLSHWQADVEKLNLIGETYSQARRAADEARKYDIIVIGSGWSLDRQNEICREIRGDDALGGTRFVLMTLERMLSGLPAADDQVLVTTSPLRRATFLTGVAVAAGRESPEVRTVAEADEFIEFEPLSIADAESRGALILVAEDNATNQRVLLQQLGKLGYTAVVAADGREALEAWKSRDFGLLLTDCHMPVMDGFELTAAVRKLEIDTDRKRPVVAITANALQGEAEKCLAAGMDDFVAKPVELTELRGLLQKWLPDGRAGTARVSHGQKISGSVDGSLSGEGAAINLERLAEMMGDADVDYLAETLRFFWGSVSGVPDELHELTRIKDAGGLKDAAHAAKGAAMSAAALDLTMLLQEIEMAAREDDWATIKKLSPSIDAKFAEVEDFIRLLPSNGV
jgi:PAS domain S-box-containing protein